MAGETLSRVLTGEVNPSGKLPVTFAKQLSDYAYTQYGEEAYPGVNNQVYYKEGVYVGYRHFDSHKVQPQFPFGFGLSYTTFKYSKPRLTQNTITDNGSVTVSVDITNTGNRAGKETVQLYIGQRSPKVERPVKELKGFEKVSLLPGETKTVNFTITTDMLAYYSVDHHDWKADNGQYTAYVCSSSEDVRGKADFNKL